MYVIGVARVHCVLPSLTRDRDVDEADANSESETEYQTSIRQYCYECARTRSVSVRSLLVGAHCSYAYVK